MTKNIKKLLTAIALIFAMSPAWAQQQVNTLYFLDNAPMRHYINPAFQPTSGFYLSLPFIGYTDLWLGNNAFTLSDLVYKAPNGSVVTALHPEFGNRDKFFNNIANTIVLDADIHVNFVSFGWAHKKSYWHFFVNERISMRAGLPRDLMKFPLYGMQNLDGTNTYDLKSLQTVGQFYTEAGIGFSHQLNKKWGFGFKVKALVGMAYVSVLQDKMKLNLGADSWSLKGNGSINMAVIGDFIPYPESLSMESLQEFTNTEIGGEFADMDLSLQSIPTLLKLLKPAGLGAAIDLGVQYQPFDMLKVSASVIDLGAIRWRGKRYNYGIDATYDGLETLSYDMIADGSITDTIVSHFSNILNDAIVDEGDGGNKFWQGVSPKVNIAVEGCFAKDKIGVGLISQTGFINHHIYEELTLGLSLRPSDWFNLAASYSFVNGRWASAGVGVSLGKQLLNLTLAADYVPMSYAQYSGKAFVPYKTEGINLAAGLSIVFGRKKVRDKDHDGVPNRRDKCKNTPPLVPVDKQGCPLDTDADGVPDYLDQCPNTTPEAHATIDAHGCPGDSDLDGVPDYLDQCPNTPKEAQELVDLQGCPLDTDVDGVPDYLDQCPNTPREAYGHVDEKGCLKDSDQDGVADYLDRCSDTPEEARTSVDENGCAIDTDKDGVADYLDQCLDTPEEARAFVDEQGCPKDTDQDSVPDYLDHCPTIAGEPHNNGCPEIKREVRNLFQKALQGIQFETGKAIIKKESYSILDEIATVLKDNPTWLVEIQGHTDNVGNPETNLELSEARAEAVKEYLTNSGVNVDHMTAKGYGDTKPVAENTTAAGRAQNRRVEFVVTFEQVTYETLDIQGNVLSTDTIAQ